MPISQSFREYFRCLDSDAIFEAAGSSCPGEGFFRFGPNSVCYGPVKMGFVAADPAAELYDASADTRVESGSCVLPFDPDIIVQNLRRERYVSEDTPKSAGGQDTFVRKAYYAVRPLLPVAARKHLQRFSLRGWDQKPFPTWPVDRSVDKMFESLMILSMKARSVKKVPFIWFWPEAKNGCVIMTHDVETKTGLDSCPSLMDLNESFGIKSSFQLIPEGRYQTTPEQLKNFRTRGFEVNVHDWNHDGRLFSDRELFLTRAAKINQAAIQFEAEGFRSGVLYRNLEWLDQLKFSYDMSVPDVGHLDPQPGGCCTVTPYFIGNILEIPLTTIQDYSLFHILGDFSIDLWKRQMELILAVQGLISFNVHPDYVIAKRERTVYSHLLGYIATLVSERNLWACTARDLNRWWRDRSQSSVVEKNGRFEIEGPAKGRARIAFATLVNERLVYSFA